MAAIDFSTALGRLLREGTLRDALAADPRAVAAQLDVRASDRAALVALAPAELEFQARVLLRKRLDAVRRVIPHTCRELGVHAWPSFHAYARSTWPTSKPPAAHDAHGFCRHLQQFQPEALCKSELNRLRFALSRSRFALHFVRFNRHRNESPPALQVLLRLGRRRWREMTFYFKL